MNKLSVSSLVSIDVGNVWQLWNEPKHIINWNSASEEWHCPRAINDLREGGSFCYRMEAKDGSMGFDLEGVYDTVKETEMITYSLADGRQSTTTFEPMKEGTRITTIFDAEETNSLEMQKNGWQAILDSFKDYAENLKNLN